MKTIIDFANKVRSLADGRISNIANVEESPSTHPYTVGKQLIFNGLLCKATSAIAVGDTLAVGTNLALSDNVVEQIYSLNQGLANSLADMNNVLGAKNLLPTTAITQTFNGVTFTANADGTVTVSGTATETVYYGIQYQGFKLPNKNLILSGCPSGGSSSTYELQVRSTESDSSQWQMINDHGDSPSFVADNNRVYVCYIGVMQGQTVSNLVFKPMLRPASIQDDTYVPYSMTNREMTPYVQAISNPNLLDNPWFTINQRGITTDTRTEGTTRYTVDRWILRGAPTITVNTDSIVINNSTGTSGHSFYQKIEENIYNKIKGKTVTLSIDAVASASGCMVGMWQGNQTPQAMGYKSIPTTRSIVKSTVKLGNVTATSPFEVLIDTVSGATLTIYSIKLELGTVSTLAMDSAPNYQQELAKCQRYFQRIRSLDNAGWTLLATGVMDSSTRFWGVVPLPVEMRSKPTISSYIGNNNVRICKGGIAAVDGVPVTSIDLDVISTHQVKIDFYCASQSSIPVGTYCTVWSSGSSSVCIDLSADL